MKTLVKNLIAGAVFASLALTGAVIAEEEVKHKTIEIKSVKGQDLNVWVDSDGDTQTLVVTAAELADEQLLADRLAGLDDQTRETVMQALDGVTMSGDGEAHLELEKVYVMNKGDGQRIEFIGANTDDVDIEIMHGNGERVFRKHIIHADGPGSTLKGHSDVIAKLIAKGEFTQDQLDEIQAALDAKR